MPKKKNQGLSEKLYSNDREQAWDYVVPGPGIDWKHDHIELNKHALERFLRVLLPGKNIYFIKHQDTMKFYEHPYVTIDTETGTIIDEDSDLTTKKVLKVNTHKIPAIDYFNEEWFPCKHMYVYDIVRHGDGIEMRVAEYEREKKKPVTFTLDASVYEKFSRLSDTMAINKSKFVENKIKEFLEKNA